MQVVFSLSGFSVESDFSWMVFVCPLVVSKERASCLLYGFQSNFAIYGLKLGNVLLILPSSACGKVHTSTFVIDV